jgi:hypothetical protein
LTFEEYDRTLVEQAGGPYTGTGNRRLLGDTITDMFGNYVFRFSFDMTFPGLFRDLKMPTILFRGKASTNMLTRT